MIRSAIMLALLFWAHRSYAQNTIILDQPLFGNQVHKAKTTVRMMHGYRYVPSGSYTMRAYIDNTLPTGDEPPSGSVSYSPLFTTADFNNRAISTSKIVGLTTGTADVTASGAASYAMPIFTPPGVGGVSPELSLVYSSQGGNGMLGIGWGLSGMSQITRINKTLHTDGEAAPVAINFGDRFALDGNPLHCGGCDPDDAFDDQFHTETETFSYISSKGFSGNGPNWFELETKDGIKMEFGRNADAKLLAEGSSTVMTWRINKVYDQYGNYMEFKYNNSDRDLRIEEISYTGNATAGVLPYNKIKFYYDQRTDDQTLYMAGSTIRNLYLLRKIKITAEGDLPVKDYEFKYGIQYSGQDQVHSYLKEVIEYASDGTTLNSTIMEYGEFQAEISTTVSTTLTNQSADLIPGDFNGDGLTDLLAARRNTADPTFHDYLTIYKKDIFPGSFTAGAVLPLASNTIVDLSNSEPSATRFLPSDVNGDGRDDVIWSKIFNSNGNKLQEIRVKLTNADASGFLPNDLVLTPGVYNEATGINNIVTTGDFDGDGRSDIVSPLGYQGLVKVFVTYPALTSGSYVESDLGIPASLDVQFGKMVQAINFDGDGKQDLFVLRGGTNCKIYSFKKNGNIVNASLLYSGTYPTSDHEIYFADFNGDGKTDLLTKNTSNTWEIAISKGTTAGFAISTFTPLNGVSLGFDHKVTVVDCNGDGLSDIVHTYPDPNMNVNPNILVDIFYSRGEDFYAAPTDLVTYNGTGSLFGGIAIRVIPGDYDGDGNQDFIFRNANGNYDMTIFLGNTFDKAKYLFRIKDGFNTTTEFVYRSMTNSDIQTYTKGTGAAYPLTDVTIPTFIVKSISKPNGVDKLDFTAFDYEGAIVHQQGKGWLGFKKVIANNNPEYVNGSSGNPNGVKTTREFEANSTYGILMPYKKTACRSANNSIQISDLTFLNEYIPLSNFSKQVWPRVQTTTNIDKLRNTTETASFAYDDYGNITQTVISNGVETVTTTEQYNYWYGSPYPARPTLTTIVKARSGEPSFTTVTSRSYNTKGKLISKTDFNGQPKALTTAYTNFDNFGNARMETISATGLVSRVSQFEFDAKGRFVTKATNALNQVSTATYDPRWGAPQLQKGADGRETASFYDPLGRLNRTLSPEAMNTGVTWGWDIKTGNGTNNTDVDNSIFTTYTNVDNRPDGKVWYDRFMRQRKSEVEGYNQAIYQVTTYDGRGNISYQTAPFYMAATPVITANTFDEFNRPSTILTSVSGGGNKGTNTFTYSSTTNGEYTVEMNNNLNPNAFQKSVTDASGRTIRAEDRGGVLKYYYHSSGQQRRVELNDAELLTMSYDPCGRPNQLSEKNSGITTYVYNAYGELESQTDANAKTHQTQYDELGRIINVTLPEGTITYQYVTSGNGLGQPQKITGYNGNYMEYGYDNLSRPIQSKELINGVLFTTSYTYDPSNNLASIIFPSGFAINKLYDSKGILTHIKNGDNTVTLFSAGGLNAYSQYTSYTLGNGKTSSMQYNQFGLPDLFSTTGVQNLDFTFNIAKGNLDSRNDILKSKTESFLFDNLNRLTTSTIGATSKTVTYKVNGTTTNGNIDTKTDIGTYEYDPVRVNAVATVTNPNSTISLLQQDIIFNSFQQPSKITENNFELTLDYGPDEMRKRAVLKQGATVQYTRYFLPDFERTNTAAGTEDVHYIQGPDGLVAMVVRTNGTDQYYYVYKDHLGSILTVTNSAGTIVAEQNFDAWGRQRNPTDWTFNSIPANPSWLYRGFTTHEHLPQFSLINMNGRLYDPLASRMLSPDNFVADGQSSQDYNRYSYGNNNPLSFSDPSGELVWWVPIAFAVGVGAATGYAKADLARQEDPWKGALRGALVGLASSALGGVGGGSFVENILWGIGEGAAVGTLNAALWGEDVGKAALNGGIAGGAFAALTTLPEAIRNYNDGCGFNTNDGVFDRMVRESVTNGTVDVAKAQDALDFWSVRNRHPKMLVVDGGSPHVSRFDLMPKIPKGVFKEGPGLVRLSIAHEIGHLNNFTYNERGEVIEDRRTGTYYFDAHGKEGYFDAIETAGRYRIPVRMLSHNNIGSFSNPYLETAWKLYGPKKWLHVIPRRFY